MFKLRKYVLILKPWHDRIGFEVRFAKSRVRASSVTFFDVCLSYYLHAMHRYNSKTTILGSNTVDIILLNPFLAQFGLRTRYRTKKLANFRVFILKIINFKYIAKKVIFVESFFE